MHWLNLLPAWPLMVLLALLTSRWLVLPGARAPVKGLAVLLQRLAKKVHPDISRSHFQQQLSGTLALLLVLALTLAIAYCFYLVSELPLVLDVLILYFCLGSRLSLQQAAAVADSINRQQLTLARERARPLLLRDRQNLSAMGLSKACIESLLLQNAANLIAVLFWFLIGGGLMALAYTLLQIAARQWNSKLPHYRYFGRTAARCYQLAVAPGLLISALLLAVQTGLSGAWRNYRATDALFFNWPSRILLATGASALGRKLGGPAYYAGSKTARQRLGSGTEPTANDILRTILLVNAQQTALIILFSSTLALYIASILLVA
ncbi:adenosylcobinamide-phosphate synthase [Arsukibacterium tuosuense]|uniref:Adenosylcobinamide-phosphate synthase n=1 Tax=Arsukibacterium tuosuense TaxID=1323745 RepID=A0A285J119_9GAMM|nr:cobalamin biosynthesis protein [Arsukibacterium tuosuense]SNY53999.1 adenosylcobinamide-phosphate synthase [Arsukibacterium tuosuense]